MSRPTIRPLRNFLLCSLEPRAPRSALAVGVPTAADTVGWVRVLAIGPEVRDVGVGNRLLVSLLAGQSVGDTGEILVPEGSCLLRDM